MTKFERKFFDFVQKYILWIIFFAVTAAGILVRACGMDFKSGDYSCYLQPWWNTIEQAGIQGLGKQVGNYNIPYQIIIYLFTLLPFGPLRSYKILSMVFDILLACSSAMLVETFSKNYTKLKGLITYSVVFCSLTIILNSAFWAQCDSIYVTFILLAVYYLKKDKNILSFVMLGLAFAFKLQVIFILPVFLFYYVSTRKISLLHFLIIPAVNFVLCLPAVFFGRSIADILKIYVVQTSYYKEIYMNCPNLYAFICNYDNTEHYELFKNFSIIFTFVVLGFALALIIYKKVDLSDKQNFLLTSIWTVFTCIMFLSSMHERYTYLLDILLIIYVVVTAKRFWLPVACNLISLRGYSHYLFGVKAFDFKTIAIIYISIYAYVTYVFFKETVLNGKKLPDAPQITQQTETTV